CGFVRSNFSFAIALFLENIEIKLFYQSGHCLAQPQNHVPVPPSPDHRIRPLPGPGWSPQPDLNR
ncbi:MAG: hypothetical protein OXG56_10635, partial [Gammaproteobacteria bacterium]|nr:hypothetical protein [Gammaproteobacteria bacterium]